jgi:transposase InsO family protein
LEAITVAQGFIGEYISLYGLPRQIHTDRGSQFTSLLFKNICEIFRIDKTQTTAFHPQSDGLVERFNRTIEDMLSKAVRRDQRNWDEILPLLMLAYRSSEHESIGFTPCMMMFGREAELPVDLLYGLPPKQQPCTHTEYVVTLSERLDKINKLAFNQMTLVRERQKRQYDIKTNKIQYLVVSLVVA